MTKLKIALSALLFLGAVLAVAFCISGSNFAVLNPKGWIALKQRDLFVVSSLLMLIVVLPALFLTGFIAWKYRASNTKAKYSPNWDYNFLAEAIWWGAPFVIVIALSVMAWRSSEELDPFKPLESDAKPITIQVVALQWKWLFIYPEQRIATVNFIQFPENVPIQFAITADAPMNSFWIPQLGGQIYAMPGMDSKLHLIAHEIGDYAGSSANLSGTGFAGMRFIAKASSQADFDAWVHGIKKAQSRLSLHEYQKLVEPSEYHPAASYALEDPDLYHQILMKYMPPQKQGAK